MTGRTCLHLLAAGAAAASIAGADAARAQCRLCDTPSTVLQQGKNMGSIRLEIEAGLDFDRLIVLGTGEGSATLRPDGSREVSGTIASISGRAMVGEAHIRGEPGRTVRVELPDRVELYSIGGKRIVIDEIISDLPSLPQLDSAGNLQFRFGGRLEIVGDGEGDYRGDIPITVEYL